MPRTTKTVASFLALALLGTTPVLAQASWQNNQSSWQNRGGWDRDAFWRDAPSDTRQRVEFLQQRIDAGVRDGSLTRNEARDLDRRLDTIRRDARRGSLSASRRDSLQARMDDLSRQIRWQRRDGDDRYGNRDGYNDDRYRTDYDASRYYRDDPRYTERSLSYNDEVYRGSDGRYYCKRSDGTTGLIVGAIGGGVLGNVIDGGRNRVGGTLIGGALGALLGRTVEQNSANSNVRCR
ncbi:glycine zipper 2TM domain-containing protein [Novosphingobium sp. JCM 18896]|uniref:glycine zipper 2TM domain-containing protein n=1 Tax=Novosphingobium sp. JCM 18896 TaxID=2989731 RepID=UPI0039B61839